MARVLIGVSGGIAAYKAVEFARLAIKAGHAVRVLATPASEQFVGPATFEGITGAPVLIQEFDPDPLRGAFPGEDRPKHLPIGHLELAERADVFLVAPASANTIAKLAAGIADSALTTAFLACTAPRLIAPAMNDRMYRNPATQANLERLRSRGIRVLEPGHGDLASKGEYGVGRLQEPEQLLAAVESALAGDGAGPQEKVSGSWQGLRVLVTAGGSREPIDGVRFIGNRSSGRMGVAVAEAALARGAEVTLVTANVTIETPAEASRIQVETTAELAAACQAAIRSADVLVMAAAPADFRPRQQAEGKLKREAGLNLELEPTEDILAGLARNARPDQVLVGFAAEMDAGGLERAREKLVRKGVSLIVHNDVSDRSIGFDVAENEVTLVSADGHRTLARAEKRQIAEQILDEIEALRTSA